MIMEYIFYSCSLISIISTLKLIINKNPMHALLYLITSILAISGIFFSIGAYFVGALEIIIYAGAIMVLFIFVVMMLNISSLEDKNKFKHLKNNVKIFPVFLISIMLIIVTYAFLSIKDRIINNVSISSKDIGISLFSTYLIAVEVVSMLLLASLIVAFHIGRKINMKDI